jgi:hypothetical protein
MSSCIHAFEVEDLALGAVHGSERRALEAHVAECADCRASLVAFEEERELFARRAEAMDPPPLAIALSHVRPHAPFVDAFVRFVRAAFSSSRIVHGVLSGAACAAALAFVVSGGASRSSDDETTMAADVIMQSRRHLASFAPAEPVACADTRTEHAELLACADDPRAVCEAMTMSNQ